MMNTYYVAIFTSQRTELVSKGYASMTDKMVELSGLNLHCLLFSFKETFLRYL